jgi:hypothetical protein
MVHTGRATSGKFTSSPKWVSRYSMASRRRQSRYPGLLLAVVVAELVMWECWRSRT